MKKVLSLAMALVMTLSLVTVSAGAKSFTDGGKIQYTEAVDVISAIDVVDGYADGTFNPGATLTRGAAAKIICNLLLGPTTAAALSADTAPFKDVPITNTFAGYIAYCSQQGIISGYSDGTFRPAGTLTSYAFMKMLLGALGYDSKIEGYTGANWSVQVAKTALGIGLDKGLAEDFNGLKSVTREEACLYAFNTLSANMVRYGSSTNIVVGDAQVSVSGERKWDDDEGAGKDNIVAGDHIVQFAERYFSKLSLNKDVNDAFGRPANTWTYKSDKIGTYSKTADAKYSKNTAEADIYKDVGLTSNSTFTVYVDGISAHDYNNSKYDSKDSKGNYTSQVVIHKGEEDDKIGEGNGAIVEVFKEDRVIAIINTYVGEVISAEKATAKRDAYVELGTLVDEKVYGSDADTGSRFVLANEKFDTDAFKVGDVVTFTYSLKDNAVKSVAAAETATGNVESFTTNKKFTMNGTSYEYGAKKVNIYGSSDIGTQSTVYMDKNGYVLYTKEGEDNLKNYALVLNAGVESAIAGDKYQAYLLFADGTTKVVTTDKNYGKAKATTSSFGDGLVGQWVTFKTNAKGETVLTDPSGTDKISGTPSTALTKNGDTAIKLGNNSLKVNSATVIIIKDQSDKFKVFEGVKGIPTITNGAANTAGAVDAYSAYGTGTFQKLVYIDLARTGVEMNTGSDKVIFLVGNRNAALVETSSDKYYVFDAVVDGQLVKDGVMLDATDGTFNGSTAKGSKTAGVITYLKSGASVALDSYSVSNGFYTVDMKDKVDAVVSGGSVDKVSGNCIDFNGAAYYTAKDCVFFRVDADGNLRTSSINGVRSDKVGEKNYYAQVFYTYNNSAELTGVYWVYNR